MLTITFRDLQWRARRIVVGVCAAMLVFAVTLLLQSVHDSFLNETDRTIAFFGGDSWVVTRGLAGPFTTNSPMKAEVAQHLADPSRAVTATPVAIFRHVVEGADARGLSDVNVIAYRPDGVVTPRPTASTLPANSWPRICGRAAPLKLFGDAEVQMGPSVNSWRSVPQMPQQVGRTRTSSSASVPGGATSSIRTSCLA